MALKPVLRFSFLDAIDIEKKNKRRTWRKKKRTAATMKGAVEGKNAAREKGALEFGNRYFYKKESYV